MLAVRIIDKTLYRNVTYYKIQDINTLGFRVVTADQLKMAARNNQITMVNATLSSDNRIFMHEERKINTKVKQNINTYTNELKQLETEDYQHRGKNGPRSGVADTIQVDGNDVVAEFKSTSESTAKKWLKDFIERKGYTIGELDAYQSGDYDNDWVTAYCTVTGKRSQNNSNASTIKKPTTNAYDEAIKSVKYRLDRILDTYTCSNYTEITGSMGGDIVTFRIHKDGTIGER